MPNRGHLPPNEPPEDALTRVQQARREAADSARPMTDAEMAYWRDEYEGRQARKFFMRALRNLLLWVVAVVGTILTCWDAVRHILGGGTK